MKRAGSVFVLAVVVLFATIAMAQGDPSYYFVAYYSNNVSSAPDSTVRIINDGYTGTNLYATFYVFDDSEELTQCCSCGVTPDGLLSESVQQQLTKYSLRGTAPVRGVIKIIASTNGYFPSGELFGPAPAPEVVSLGLHAWITDAQAPKNSANKQAAGVAYSQTESKFADANLASSEQSLLEELCYFDRMLSGQPCTCTTEDQDF